MASTSGRRLAVLSLTALGIVYGDIGTSPLYAIRESLQPAHGLPVSAANVLGVLSCIVWSLIIVISIKYLGYILRADDHGEGGILALASLATPMDTGATRSRRGLVLLGLAGTALLYGDGAITPAISVLSAVEGLAVATPVFTPYVIPITLGILIALFLAQHHGTGRVGGVFGPIVVLWLLTLATLGIAQLIRQPAALAALDPRHAMAFFSANGSRAFIVLGSVFLVVTGGEALYADLGHFGTRPIRLAWFGLALPALLLNYFGQGALLLETPEAIRNPFYLMVPAWALYPVVGLATAATVVASQALISGAYSLTLQAVRLGCLPRMRIEHTSDREKGQIYIPAVNRFLMVACLALVVGFGSSAALASAYGVAVTTTMVITTVLFHAVARTRWGWSRWHAGVLTAAFLAIDLAFFGANLLKIPDGGWFPIAVGSAILALMLIWRRGRRGLAAKLRGRDLPPEAFAASLAHGMPTRVPGVAVFLIREPDVTPPALLHNLKHNRVLHEHVLLLTVVTEGGPTIAAADRVTHRPLGHGMHQVTIRFGYREDQDVPGTLRALTLEGVPPLTQPTYFLARERVVRARRTGTLGPLLPIFAWLNRNAPSASAHFRLPPNRVVELGAQVEL
ncbi:MAG TPA: KUP/HAK/KT family potassium transporter [Gemmatimonadales bacterium]|nr:potassium transporter Kup [Gemmatimonadales bacterium]HPF62706.1 KUP/HAK/KT family potassium transporter [Gemmatimonadales bacterium]HRX20025.1 KUP/HAK/KT family potassium transporter [Gemmatimonadales bacterium]